VKLTWYYTLEIVADKNMEPCHYQFGMHEAFLMVDACCNSDSSFTACSVQNHYQYSFRVPSVHKLYVEHVVLKSVVPIEGAVQNLSMSN
jgi:hypothetical protein